MLIVIFGIPVFIVTPMDVLRGNYNNWFLCSYGTALRCDFLGDGCGKRLPWCMKAVVRKLWCAWLQGTVYGSLDGVCSYLGARRGM